MKEKLKGQTEITKKQAKKWANALRSGEFQQTTGTLQDKHGFCCLGVACEIFIPESLKMRQEETGFLKGDGPDEYQLDAPAWLRTIDGDIEDKANAAEDSSFSEGDGDLDIHSFMEMNDSKDFSFDEIADIIELVYVHRILD